MQVKSFNVNFVIIKEYSNHRLAAIFIWLSYNYIWFLLLDIRRIIFSVSIIISVHSVSYSLVLMHSVGHSSLLFWLRFCYKLYFVLEGVCATGPINLFCVFDSCLVALVLYGHFKRENWHKQIFNGMLLMVKSNRNHCLRITSVFCSQ